MIARDRAKLIFHANDKPVGAFEPLERGGEAVQVFRQAEIRHALQLSNTAPVKLPSRQTIRHLRIVRNRSNEMPKSDGMTLNPFNLIAAPSFVALRTRHE